MPLNQKGSAALPLAVLVFGLIFASSVVPVTRNYSDGKGSGDVQGVSAGEDVNIATDSGQTALVNKSVGALTLFSLSIDPTTKEVTAATPAGSKVVAILPEKAVNNMLAAKIMSYVKGEKVHNSLSSVPKLVTLEVKKDVLGYSVEGVKVHKLLGLIPVKSGVEAFVSAEDGAVVESTQSLLGRILNKIAP